MSYRLFKPNRFICEQELNSYAFSFKGPTVEFANPATAPGIADNTTVPGRYFLSKTLVAFSAKPGLKVEPRQEGDSGPDDFTVSWLYGCPHRCVYCPNIYLCKNYPYVCADPRIDEVENAIRAIAASWRGDRPFVCRIGGLGDLLAVEHLTGWLSRLIPFFASEIAPHGQLRIVTRSGNFAPLVPLDHRRCVAITVPLAPARQLDSMEPGAASLSARLNLLTRLIAAGYPVHISFGPVLDVPDFERLYEQLFHHLSGALLHAGAPSTFDLSVSFEILSVKPESEGVIAEIAPHALDGLLNQRIDGCAVLAYPEETNSRIGRYFRRFLSQYFPTARIIS